VGSKVTQNGIFGGFDSISAVFKSYETKINMPIRFSTQKSVKIQIFSLVQKISLILLACVMIDLLSHLINDTSDDNIEIRVMTRL